MSSDIEKVVNDFTTAERALQSILQQIESLQEAETRVDVAWTSLESAGAAVSETHTSLHALADKFSAAATSLENTSADFRSAATALNRIEPDRLLQNGEETKAETRQLGERLQQVMEARTSAVTDAVVAAIGSARSDIAGEVRRVATQVDSTGEALGRIEASAAANRKVLNAILIVASISIVVAAVAAISAFILVAR